MFVKKCYSCKSSAVNILKSCNNWKTLHQFCSKCGKDQTRHILRRKTLKTPLTRTKHPKPVIRGSIAFILLFWAISALAFEPAVVTYQSQLEDIKVQATAIKVQLKQLSEKEIILDKINKVAEQYGVDPKEMEALIECESHFNPKAVNINKWESSHGLIQLNLRAHPYTVEQAEDPDFAIEFMAQHLSKGEYHMWKICSKRLKLI